MTVPLRSPTKQVNVNDYHSDKSTPQWRKNVKEHILANAIDYLGQSMKPPFGNCLGLMRWCGNCGLTLPNGEEAVVTARAEMREAMRVPVLV